MERVKALLSKEFEMKYFFGMEVVRASLGIYISQSKYVIDLLKESGMLGSKSVDTPMDANVKLEGENDSPLVDK